MQIILRCHRYPFLGTYRRQYPTNAPLNVSDAELAELRTALKNNPDFEILERQSKLPAEDLEKIDAVVDQMIHREPEAQEKILLTAFTEFSPEMRSELKVRLMIDVMIPDALKRSIARILDEATMWEVRSFLDKPDYAN